MRKKAHSRVLVLNADYQPHGVISWKRAIVLNSLHEQEYQDGAELIKFYANDFIVDSKGRQHPIPAVVRLTTYIKRAKNAVPFSRKNVFLRDKLTCQYCGKQFPPEELTYDHVIPRAQWDNDKNGTPTHWENIVTCCGRCNKTKRNRTPKQAQMKLLREPMRPNGNMVIHGLTPWSKIPIEWIEYLPPLYQKLMNT